MQTGALGAQDEGARPRPVPRRVVHVRVPAGADDPDIAPLYIFDKPVEVGHFGNVYVLERTGGGFGDGVGQAHGAAFGDDDTVRARALGGPENRTEISRV